MAVTIEQTAPCRKTLRVEIAADRVSGKRAEILQEFRRGAALPGFRPGKAPEPMVEKKYAREIDDELRKRLIPDSYREALMETKIHAVGYPEIKGVECQPGQPLRFAATVDTAPEFALPDYKAIAVKKKEIVIADDEITKSIDELRDQQAEFISVEGRALRTGDFAVINYSGIADGKPIAAMGDEVKTLGEHKDFWLLIEPEAFLPGFCDQLLGAQAAERRQVLVDFPADFPQKPLAGRKATYFVEVTAIKEKKLPEPNDEFAKKVGVDSVEKLKDEIRKGFVAEREEQAKTDMRHQIMEYLLGKISFDLPESLVATETRSIIYELVRENSMRGVTKEQLETKKDEIYGFATQSARDRLRGSFILDEIARAENISVQEAEIEERVRLMAERYRVPLEKFKAQLEERSGLGEIEEQLLVAKTLDFLLANAKVEPTQSTTPAS